MTSSGYQIQGVKNVSVAVDAETYVDAQALKAASKLPREGVYTEAADITLNEAPSQETGQYKNTEYRRNIQCNKIRCKSNGHRCIRPDPGTVDLGRLYAGGKRSRHKISPQFQTG